MKTFLIKVANSHFTNLAIGIILVLSGLFEFGETLIDSFMEGDMHTGHGIIFLGCVHILKAIGEMLESLEHFKEGIEGS